MNQRRTPLQKRSDEFDRQLFKLLSAAEQNADTLDRTEKAIWQETAIYLRRSRSAVRCLMHPDDRIQTS